MWKTGWFVPPDAAPLESLTAMVVTFLGVDVVEHAP
jgi:hypothetical protein